VTLGYRLASSGACIQWVAARCASRIPAAANKKLPIHTEHTRLHAGAFFLTHWIRARSRVTSSTTKAPGTISVSIRFLARLRTDLVLSSTPSAVFTRPPRADRTLHSYLPPLPFGRAKAAATRKASNGPERSSNETPS